jgi:hypothetical protein
MKFKFILVLTVIAAAGIFLLFFRIYHNDVQSLEAFSAAYENYDRAISDYSTAFHSSNLQSTPVIAGYERTTAKVLGELNLKASARISSLIKNDSDLMSAMREIAELSGNEFDSVKTYQNAAANQKSELEKLAQVLDDLTKQRQTAYTNFQELGGQSVTADR